jgi:hypothetical protein
MLTIVHISTQKLLAEIEETAREMEAKLKRRDAQDGSTRAQIFQLCMYREIIQIKQDGITPVFRCQVTETILSQYCGHYSSTGKTRYIQFFVIRSQAYCISSIHGILHALYWT